VLRKVAVPLGLVPFEFHGSHSNNECNYKHEDSPTAAGHHPGNFNHR
jgi:hypothetical protein